MAKYYKASKKRQITTIVAAVIILLILLAGYLLYRHFVFKNINNYLIENKYYGFKLKTPKSWIAQGESLYSEDNIAQILTECESDKSNRTSFYEIGRFRFESQRYSQSFGDMGYFPSGSPSGAILDISINCIPDSVKNKIDDYSYGKLKIGGEKTFDEVLNLPEFGKTEYLSFFHNNFQYRVNEYVYISPSDKSPAEKERENYTEIFDEITSSLKFTPVK